jgi:hypothetical protein
MYWQILVSVIDDFFASHNNEMDIGWDELVRFSSDLVEHSAPFAEKPMETPDDAGAWYSLSEISQRGRRGGAAISPVVLGNAPDAQSIANLKQLCCYVIYYSTFVHSWTHDKMLLDLGELRYSGMVRNGGLGPEEDDRFIAPIRQATFALGSTHTLSSMNCGTMFRNDDGDVPAQLIARLKQQKAAFQTHGFDVERLCARLNT